MKMKTRTKIVTSIIAIVLSCVLLFTVMVVNNNTNTTVSAEANVRTVELTKNYFDDQSIFDEFDEHEFTTEGNFTYFEGVKTLDESYFCDIDNVDIKSGNSESVKIQFNVSLNVETNMVVLSTKTVDTGIILEEASGEVFENNGKVDAWLCIDGENVLLSELTDSGVIENCGILARLIRCFCGGVVGHILQGSFALSNRNYNKKLPNPSGFINDQLARTNWKYGVGSNIATFGCGVIAMYNVMEKLKRHVDFADMIYEIDSKSGDLFLGVGGVDVSHFREYFGLRGIGFKGYYNFSDMKTALSNMSLNQMAIISYWTSSGCGHYIAVERILNENTGKTEYNFYNYESEDKCDNIKEITTSCFKKGFINGFVIG
ncbi:MAG: hypothetical protein K2O62_02590 [Clostridia bacterium]|nr:hypothetical protein [Clostridia bacterium]